MLEHTSRCFDPSCRIRQHVFELMRHCDVCRKQQSPAVHASCAVCNHLKRMFRSRCHLIHAARPAEFKRRFHASYSHYMYQKSIISAYRRTLTTSGVKAELDAGLQQYLAASPKTHVPGSDAALRAALDKIRCLRAS